MDNKKIIFGRNPVYEYLKQIDTGTNGELYVSKNAHGKIITSLLNLAKSKKLKISYEEKKFFQRLGSSSSHQGIALKIQSGKKTKNLIELLQDISKKNGTIIFLDQLSDPHNIGAIIRTAEALGCDAVLITKTKSPAINQTIIKTSAGATAHINIEYVQNAASFLNSAKEMGFWIVGTSDHSTKELEQLENIHPCIIVIGSEGTGIRKLTEDKCDFTVKIPLRGKVSSLNASVAAGIIIYEIMKNKT